MAVKRKRTRVVLTDEQAAAVEAAVAMGATIPVAAWVAGVPEGRVRKRIDSDPDFKQRLQTARERADQKVIASLYDKALKGNVTAMIFWLKNRLPNQWRDRRDHVVEGQGGGPLKIVLEDARGDE